jgi:transposase-like protein
VLAERGIAVSDETIRWWCRKFGQTFADGLRGRQPRPGDTWHVDEMRLKINGYEPQVVITDKLASYPPAARDSPSGAPAA